MTVQKGVNILDISATISIQLVHINRKHKIVLPFVVILHPPWSSMPGKRTSKVWHIGGSRTPCLQPTTPPWSRSQPTIRPKKRKISIEPGNVARTRGVSTAVRWIGELFWKQTFWQKNNFIMFHPCGFFCFLTSNARWSCRKGGLVWFLIRISIYHKTIQDLGHVNIENIVLTYNKYRL